MGFGVGKVNLSWNAVPGAKKYRIWRRKEGQSTWYYQDVEGITFSDTDSGWTSGTPPSVTNAFVLKIGTGGLKLPFKVVSSNYTATENDFTILCTNTSSITITLPNPANYAGKILVIKRLGTGGVTVYCDQYIDGSTSVSLASQYNSIMVQSDGTRWYILAQK